MFELFLTYWFSWILFIIIMFFWEKGRLRSFLLFSILIMLIFFPVYITILSIRISIVVFIMFIISMILFVRKKPTYFRFLTTFSMTIGYIGLLFWQKVSPIWFFMPTFMMFSLIIVGVIIFLQKGLFEQISSVILSVLAAHFLYDIFLHVYDLHHELSNDAILTINFSTLLLLMVYFLRANFQKIF